MFGMEMLDVLIGLATVYTVFGIACTAIVEAVVSWLSVRSRNLEIALSEFLAGQRDNSQKFVDAFYEHPLVQSLSKGDNGRPSYIPPEVVGQVVEALLHVDQLGKSLRDAVDALPGDKKKNRIKGMLDTLVTQAGNDAVQFRKAVETHFNASMDRASGWFKRYTQNIALAVAAALVIGANLDTVALTSSLASSPAARVKLVEIAEQQVRDSVAAVDLAKAAEDAGALSAALDKTVAAQAKVRIAADHMDAAGLQFGWTSLPKTPGEILSKIAGLIISIVAVSLGAPFWFSILQRFMQVRASGVSPAEKKEEKTEEKPVG